MIGTEKRATGLEPATSSLGSWHSTTELRPLRIIVCPSIQQSRESNLEKENPGLVLLSHSISLQYHRRWRA